MSVPGSRPSLVLLCGLLCDAEIWSDVASQLRPVVDIQVFSFLGFNSIQAMADHVLQSTQGRICVGGHSMGGRVALEMMRRCPGRLSGLALLNTGVHAPAESETESRGRLVALARAKGMKQLADAWLPPLLAEAAEDSPILASRLTAMVERATPGGFEAQTRALLSRPNASEVLSGIEVPVQLVSATLDRWSPPSQHEAMRRRCMTADFSIVKDAGHMSPIENPLAVAAALVSWIDRVKASESDAQRLSANDKVLIEKACTKQMVRYARLTDDCAFATLSDMFTEDGVLARPSDPSVLIHGRNAILKSLQSRGQRLTRHLITNIEVVVETQKRARARCTVLLINGSQSDLPVGQNIVLGNFNDALQKVGEDWLFQQRRGYIALKSEHKSEAA